MATSKPNPDLEFSFPVEVAQIASLGRTYTISAKENDKKRVAVRLGLLELPNLSATVTVAPGLGGIINVSGRLSADVVQLCVVTLDPLPAKIGEDFAVFFSREPLKEEGEELEVLPDEDPPELLTGEDIDLGEIVVEQLALLLDPYPRAPGAVFESPKIGVDDAENNKVSPFAALAKLKTNNKNN